MLMRGRRVVPLAFVIGCVVAAAGCKQQLLIAGDLACSDAGECIDGWICHPETGLCVEEVTVGCGGGIDETCPSTTTTGSPCPSPGSFLPCDDAVSDCNAGCRTCNEDGTWSECSPGVCQTGTVTHCSACGDDCLAPPNVTAADCNTTGSTPICEITGCAAGFADTDRLPGNGCERTCVSTGAETCNGIDDDCNGPIDDVDPTDLTTQCNADHGNPPDVTAWRCESGGCMVETCATDTWDINTTPGDGCEYGCTWVGPEVCNGVDENCTLTPDDMTQAEIDADCALQNGSAVHVVSWSCTGGLCDIAACEANWTNSSGGIADGCESGCTPTVPPTEVCGDGIDNNCDGFEDEAGAQGCTNYYADVDVDGFGDDNDMLCLCAATAPHIVTVGGDCNDAVATCTDNCIKDDDGDGTPWCADTCVDEDLDGYGAAGGAGDTCTGADCDDDPLACGNACNAGLPELCDGEDNDCSGTPDDNLTGAAACANQIGVCSGSVQDKCGGSAGWAACDDLTYTAWAASQGPAYENTGGGDETICGDGADNDCDGTPDDGCPATPFTVFDSSNSNLINDDVTDLFVDASGNLWVATGGDGEASYLAQGSSTFQDVAGLQADPLLTVIVDTNGDAWFGYDQDGNCDDGGTPGCDCGATRIEAGTLNVTYYCTDYMSGSDNSVVSMVGDPSGHVYIGAADDYAIYYPSPDDTIACDESIGGSGGIPGDGAGVAYAMVLDGESPAHMWIGTKDRMRECVPDHPNTSSCDDSCSNRDNAFGGGTDRVSDIYFWDRGTPGATADDVLWVGSFAKGVSLYSLATNSAIANGPWNDTNGLPSNNVPAVAFYGAGSLGFAATAGDGLAECALVVSPPADCTWTLYTTNEGLPSDSIRSLALDAAGAVLWIGTDAGVVRMRLP